MAVICPTVTAYTLDDYRDQFATVTAFADRVHVDLGDGEFTTKMVGLEHVEWPETALLDIHLMYKRPESVLPQLVALQPSLVVVHAEAEGNLEEFFKHLQTHAIRVGLALLQGTTVESMQQLLKQVDHVLIFSGQLGSFGGTVDTSLMKKIAHIRAIKPSIEIGWDGGVNASNVRQLADGGVDVLNVGGAIQKAMRPENAYRDLVRRITP